MHLLVALGAAVASPENANLTSDADGTVRNSPEIVKSVAKAAERARQLVILP